MYILLIYLTVCVIGGIHAFSAGRCSDRIVRTVFLCTMAFFMLRFGLGSDTRTYIHFYQVLPDSIPAAVADHSYRFPLYNLLMLFVRRCGGSYAVFFGLLNLTVVGCISYTILKESSDWMLSLMIFLGSGILMTYYSSAIRQAVSMAVFFLAFYRFLLRKQYGAYYLAVIPLCFIHEVSVITLVLPLFFAARKFFLSRKGILKFTIVAVLAFLAVSIGLPAIAAYLPKSWRKLVQYNNSGTVSILGLGLRTVLFSMVLILFRYAGDTAKHSQRIQFEMFVCYLSFLIYLLFVRTPLVSRVSDYLEIIHLILIPELVGALSSLQKRKLACLGIAVLYLALLILDLRDNVSSWYYDQNLLHYPYISVFNTQDIAKYYSLMQ